MRVTQDQKAQHHSRIVDNAARLLREQGIENTVVTDVMAAAGRTHGGFYRHFASKDALVEAALHAAFSQIEALLDNLNRTRPADAVAAFQAHYLSDAHCAHPGRGCPIAALAGDVAHAGAAQKAVFGAGVQRVAAGIAAGLSGSPGGRRAQALRHLAMLAGAVAIARASDPDTARAVLTACRETR
jgi:TetR/AcrR family transcriptional repressor of nem operon